MARQRQGKVSSGNAGAGQGSGDKGSSNIATTETVVKEKSHMAGTALTLDEVNAILAAGRTRGEYAEYLSEFIASGEPGQRVDLTSGVLTGKTVDQAATGFTNARKAMDSAGNPKVQGGKDIKVLKNKEKTELFLINTALVQAG